MSHPFMSEAWVRALEAQLATSESYKKAAGGWKTTIALAVKPEEDKGITAGAAVLDLEGGLCKQADRIEGAGPYDGEYVMRGVLENWKKLLSKEIFPAPALMSGQIQLVQGSTTALMIKMGAAQALLDEAGKVPTAWP